MSNYDLLISCASWEERFSTSIQYHQENNQFDQALIFGIEEFSASYSAISSNTENSLKGKLVCGGIQYISAFNDVLTWKAIQKLFSEHQISGKKILIDVSTMPRYLIWYILHFLVTNKNTVNYYYFSPDKYENCDSLTEEPITPRLIFKHSGIFLPNRNSVLIIQSGFDTKRVSQLINTYEPEKIVLGIQVGDQLNNISKNLKQHKEQLNYQEIEYFALNAFENDHGYSAMKEKVLSYKDNKNILMASFGPKLSAIKMFRINLEIPETGLVDVPVRFYNQRYSHGTNLNNIQKGTL